MENETKNLEFLQSAQWRKFQENVGRKTFHLEGEDFSASIVEHSLPLVGKYWYVPKGPIFSYHPELVSGSSSDNTGDLKPGIPDQVRNDINSLIELAKKENAGWIRIEPENEEILKSIQENIAEKVIRSPHDMQPKEVFVLDILKETEILLAEMKPKTRYNIKLAQKKGVSLRITNKYECTNGEIIEAFLKLTKEMAVRNGITAHPEQYYRKMIETLPIEMLKIYVAEYENKIIAANLVLFYGKTVTYLHGASGNEHRNVMAPFLLQWQAILDAKEMGYERYDFGGVKSTSNNQQSENNKNTWEGITTFKFGFSLNTQPIEFPGSYDIVINSRKYGTYRVLQKVKGFLHKIHK